MSKLARFLKPYILPILLCVVLLFVQANADLNLPRVLGEVSPAPAAPVFQRGGHAESGPAADRYAADRHARGSTKVTSEFKSSDLSVGLHAVDYYVYRLCRLII